MLSIPLPLPFVPSPPPAPPAVPDSTYWRLVEQWIYYLRTRYLLPNNVTTPPNNWPGTVGPWFNTFFALLYIELNFPASLADGTLEGKPVRPPDAPIGTNPALERIQPLPVALEGTYIFRNLRRWRVYSWQIWEYPQDAIETWIRGNPIQSAWIPERPFSVDVHVTVENATGYIGHDMPNTDWGRKYVVSEKHFNTETGQELFDFEPRTGWVMAGTDNWPPPYDDNPAVNISHQVIVEDSEYFEEVDFPPAQKPGPVFPQPSPWPPPVRIPQPLPEIAPAPLTEPDAPLVPAPVPETVVRPRVRRLPAPNPDATDLVVGIAAPPIPADFDVVAPAPLPLPNVIPSPTPEKITETDVEGLPIPAIAPLPQVTDPNVHFPWPGAEPATPGGVPATLAGIAAEVGRIENKTSQIGKSMGGLNAGDLALLAALLADLLAALQPEQGFPSDTYTLTGVCEELNDSGKQPVFSTPVGGGTFPEATLSRLDAMQYLLQAHLGYKTPTCGSTKPAKEGDWVTVRFESDAPSPSGKSPLRKLLRYRTKSGADLGTTTAHWSDFTWQAGPVCVIHKGAWWGTPQVWARDANEGKRVIRHAAGEAGIDPDQNGEWSVSGSDNPRYGMPGTMRVAQVGGLDWVTKRDGPNGLPD